MRDTLPLALLGLALAAAAVADDAVEPLAVLQAQVGAWNGGDLAAFCEAYAEDATFLSPSGVTRGRQAVLERYRQRYPDRAAMGTLVFEPLDTRISPGIGNGAASASVAARWRLQYPGKPEASGLTLLVLHRTGGRWRIVQDASF